MKQFRYMLVLSFLIISVSAFSQLKEYTYRTYALKEFNNWPQKIDSLQNEILKSPDNTSEIIELFSYYYGYIGHLLDINNKDKASVWTKKANEAFSKLAKDKDIPAFAAFSSIFKAYEIAITPVKAPFLISGVLSSAKKAYSLDSKSPYTNIANANLMFYFPESLGGDKKKALEYYQNAYKYYINNPEQASTDWIYLNILSTIGVVYEKIGDRANAKRWWIEAERIEPEFKHVTNVLLPRVNDVNI